MLNTVLRTGQVLELFDREHPEWGVTEIARKLDVPKTNAHEILSTLASINLLQRSGRSRYRLGWRLVGLATGVPLSDGLRRHAPDVMQELASATGQTTHLAVWDGQRLMFLARVLGRHGFDQPHAKAGSRLLAHCTASGKVLLADLPWNEVVERVAADGMEVRTSHSLSDESGLERQLQQVREAGVGYNLGETDLGVAALAAPVRDADGRAVAALGVTVEMANFLEFRERHESLLKAMSRSLGRRLREGGHREVMEWAPDAASAPPAPQRGDGSVTGR